MRRFIGGGALSGRWRHSGLVCSVFFPVAGTSPSRRNLAGDENQRSDDQLQRLFAGLSGIALWTSFYSSSGEGCDGATVSGKR